MGGVARLLAGRGGPRTQKLWKASVATWTAASRLRRAKMSNWAALSRKIGAAPASALPVPAPKKAKKSAANHARPEQPSTSSTSSVAITEPSPPGMIDTRARLASDVAVRVASSSYIDEPSSGIATQGSNPALEAARLRAIQSLGKVFTSSCAALGSRKFFAHYETWLWASRTGRSSMVDSVRDVGAVVPVVPERAGEAARAELLRKLVKAGESEASAQAACDALDAACRKLSTELRQLEASGCSPAAGGTVQVRRAPRGDPAGPPPPKGGKRKQADVESVGSGASEEVPRWVLTHGSTEVTVTDTHLDKLKTLWAAMQGKTESTDPMDDNAFRAATYCVLARLMSLQGGHEQAGGMQGACPPGVFDTLRADFGVTAECFASPLNTRFFRFCSASVDVDAPFGSRGSFFEFRPASGAFLANPPFDPTLVSAMASHMEVLLQAADKLDAVLLFVIVIPTWPDAQCWKALHDSKHCTSSIRLPKSKHAYIDGGQHQGRRAVPLRLSNHDSTVFLLQSAKSAGLASLSFQKERRLREAFTAGLKINGALHK